MTDDAYVGGPVWNAFGLTYASYAVFPRRALQSMPREWQAKLVALIDEAQEALPEGTFDGDYTVHLRVNGKFAKDPLADYRHGAPLPYRAPA